MAKTKAKPKIVAETVRQIEERAPPAELLFEYRPGVTSEAAIAAFLSGRFVEELPTEGVAETEEGGAVALGRADKLDLYIEETAFDSIFRQCVDSARHQLETMGLMVGQHYTHKGASYAIVDRVVTSKLDATAVTVKFSRESLEDLFKELDEVEYDYIIAGWYHSHPGYTSFMSSVDVDTQRRMFSNPLSAALVVDPVRLDWKAFRIVEDRCLEIPYAVYGRPSRRGAPQPPRQLWCTSCNKPTKAAPDDKGIYVCTKCGASGEGVRFANFSVVRRDGPG